LGDSKERNRFVNIDFFALAEKPNYIWFPRFALLIALGIIIYVGLDIYF
jgi:hypothetical protein